MPDKNGSKQKDKKNEDPGRTGGKAEGKEKTVDKALKNAPDQKQK